MRPSFQPRLINGPFDDPGLLVSLIFHKRAILFDLGDLSALSAGDILKTDHIFVSHTHMDHFIGFDRIVRLLLARSKTVSLYGPEGFLENVNGKLSGYTWNLIHNFPEALTLKVTEVRSDRSIHQTFDCRAKFIPGPKQTTSGFNTLLYQDAVVNVTAAILDHQIPCLAFSLQEHFHVNIFKAALDSLGLPVGPWISTFKRLLYEKADPQTTIDIPDAAADGDFHRFAINTLASRIARITPGQKITYVVDALYSPENEVKIIDLARDSDQLFIEAAFLHRDSHIARAKHHLTARQAGLIARNAGVRKMTVFHHSPRYTDQGDLLEAEAREAFEKGDA